MNSLNTDQLYYRNNRDRILKRASDYYHANKEKICAQKREQYVRVVRPRPDTKRRQKNWRLMTRYGISLQDYEALIRERLEKCDICKKHLYAPHVDHDPVTKKIRGILCSCCNQGIGLLRHDPSILQHAIDYLKTGVK